MTHTKIATYKESLEALEKARELRKTLVDNNIIKPSYLKMLDQVINSLILNGLQVLKKETEESFTARGL